MKKRRILFITFLLLLIFTMPVMAASTKKIKKGQKKLTVTAGRQYIIKVKNAKSVKWTAKKTSKYQITKKGVLKAKKPGTTTLSYKVGSKKYKIRLFIKKKSSSSGSGSSGNPANTNSDTVYWTPGGEVYHSTARCPSLARSKTILSGSLSSCPKNRACKNCH